MIEPTDEFIAAFDKGVDQHTGYLNRPKAEVIRAGMSAVIPIIEATVRRQLAEEICALAANRAALRILIDNAGGDPDGKTSMSRARSLLRELAAIGGPLDLEPQDPANVERSYQWGVRTVYMDDSRGIDWTNEDDARSFLAYYADYDAAPAMSIRSRELVRRLIDPGDIEVVDSDYATRRHAADERLRAQAGHPPRTTTSPSPSESGDNRG